MLRILIQDIVHQTADGITYLATDRESGEDVALRRFFPYGPNGSGMDAENNQRYLEICEQLKTIEHPSLRKVLDGFIDPLDGIPYMTTEWVEGKPLTHTLNGEPLESAKLIELTCKAIEVSIIISDMMGEEAVWIDTTDRSVVGGPADEGREFTFWVCPFRCMGLYPLSTGIDSIAELTEAFAGWKSKLYSEQTCHGLGGWVKAMKRAPQTSLREALERLPQLEQEAPPAPETPQITVSPRPGSITQPQPNPTTTKHEAQSTKHETLQPTALGTKPIQSSSKTTTINHETQPTALKSAGGGTSWLVIAGIGMAAVIAVGALSFVLRPAGDLPALAENSQADMTLPGMEPESAPEAKFEEIALKSTNKTASLDTTNDAPIRRMMSSTAASAPADKRTGDDTNIISPDNTQKIDQAEIGSVIQMRGTLMSATTSNSGKSLYLNFSKPFNQKQIRGVAYPNAFRQPYDPKTFNPYIGKEIIITGKYKKQSSSPQWLITITSLSDIKIVE